MNKKYKNTFDFESTLPNVRLRKEDFKLITMIIKEDYKQEDPRYEGQIANYVRCALRKLNKEEQARLRLKVLGR